MIRWLRLAMLVLVLVAAWAIVPGAALAAIEGSVHDFYSASAPNPDFTGTAAGGLHSTCGTCHVMHHSTDSQLMWNHTLSSNTLTFGTDTSTFAGTTLPTNIGSSPGTTKYCLSCHDGSVAVGDVAVGTDWGTNMITGEAVIAPGGSLFGIHPVAVPYPDQVGATYNSITTAADPTGYVPAPTGVKLYGAATGTKGVECGSCHEVHADNTHGPLLRSGFGCTACHVK